MALCGGEGKEEGHPLRCLDAARYAAATMVTVLILIVIVKATKVVLFPESLYVSVSYGSVLVTRVDERNVPPLVFWVSLRIYNPNPRIGRPAYYVNITTYLFDNDTPASSSNPAYDSIAYFKQRDIAVYSQGAVALVLRLHIRRKNMDPKFFNLLYNDESANMSGVTMRMDAMLLIEDASGRYNTSRRVTYYCWPLVILHHKNLPDDDVDDLRLRLGDDVFCRDVRGSHFI